MTSYEELFRQIAPPEIKAYFASIDCHFTGLKVVDNLVTVVAEKAGRWPDFMSLKSIIESVSIDVLSERNEMGPRFAFDRGLVPTGEFRLAMRWKI